MSATAPSRLKVILAFAAIYLVWGSTYFFIRVALDGFPPFIVGAIRFLLASLLLLGYCAATGQNIRPGKDLRNAVIVGALLLFIGNGAVTWVEQQVASGVVAIMIAAAPLWFVILDRRNWAVNFKSPSIILGILAGFGGVLLLFSEQLVAQVGSSTVLPEVAAMVILTFSTMAWCGGSLFAKRNPPSIPPAVNTGWQMLTAGVCFSIAGLADGEWHLDWSAVPLRAWMAVLYLALFGSIVAFSAYVWLLKVRPATQVSTYAYVNPVVAVLLGVWVGKEPLGWHEVAGLAVILGAVLMINLVNYRRN